jgi:hypothetical protein
MSAALLSLFWTPGLEFSTVNNLSLLLTESLDDLQRYLA